MSLTSSPNLYGLAVFHELVRGRGDFAAQHAGKISRMGVGHPLGVVRMHHDRRTGQRLHAVVSAGVVRVAVGVYDLGDAKALFFCLFDQYFLAAGRVDDNGLACLFAAHDIRENGHLAYLGLDYLHGRQSPFNSG